MKRVLVVGCSFVGLLNPKQLAKHNPGHLFDVCGMSAAGNQSIAAQTLYKLSTQKYDHVIVLWSGINRIDVPLGNMVHNTMNYPTNQPCYVKVGNHFWYHSGGFGCGGIYPPTPDFIIKYFHAQYREPDSLYLTDISLQLVWSVNNVIKSLGIPFYSSFIYDIHEDYTDSVDKMFGHSLDYTLGKANRDSTFLPMLADSLTITNTPYECARDSNNLDTDEFHPTRDFMLNWVNTVVLNKLL